MNVWVAASLRKPCPCYGTPAADPRMPEPAFSDPIW
jgi:hypothetical protein